MPEYLLAIDQGTTGSRAILYDSGAKKIASSYQEISSYYPQAGWVEQDPNDILNSVLRVTHRCLGHRPVKTALISGIGITNQRETTLLWDTLTGKACGRAIVWQDRRTHSLCKRLSTHFSGKKLTAKTGLVWDPYFSASKIAWMLKHQKGLKNLSSLGRLAFGTVDSWLLWNLTGGKVHATDYTNASRTLLFNIHTKKWDPDLIRLFGLSDIRLPQVMPSGSLFGCTSRISGLPDGIPIHSVMGDQQSALYGQSCYAAGEVKNTYGTGCFLVAQAGSKPPKKPHGLILTLATDKRGNPTYALEGAIFIAGAAVQWLRDSLNFFRSAHQTDKLAGTVASSEGITFIPAFVGLGSPHWNSTVRGIITGITAGVKPAHIVRAALESVAHQTADVMDILQRHLNQKIAALCVDGGMTRNKFLMQFQSDLISAPVRVSEDPDLTCWGTAKLAGRQLNFWRTDVDKAVGYQTFYPSLNKKIVKKERQHWKKQLQRLLAD